MTQKTNTSQKQVTEQQISNTIKRNYNDETKTLKLFFRNQAQIMMLKCIGINSVKQLHLSIIKVMSSWQQHDGFKSLTDLRIRMDQCYEQDYAEHAKYSEKGIKRLMDKNWPSLTILIIQQMGLKDFGSQIIFKTSFNSLIKLRMHDVSMGSLGLQPIVTQRYRDLIFLRLTNNQNIGCNGVKLLVKTDMIKLQILMLDECGISNQGARYLVKGNWPNFQVLTINDNLITLDGHFGVLFGGWKNLRKFRAGYASQEAYNILIEPIQYMSLVLFEAQNVRMLMKIMSYMNEELMEDVNAILSHRYLSHEEDEEQEKQEENRYELQIG